MLAPRHRWWITVTLAEALGFLAPAGVGVATSRAGIDGSGQALLLIAGGAIEGLVLGAGQAWAFPMPIRKARFAAWTSLGAAVAWANALLILWLARLPALLAAIAIAAGSCLALFSLWFMGAAQWIELRHHAPRARRWIAWTALAWLLALPLSFAPGPFVDETTPLAAQIALWGTAGLLMAGVMGLVTWQGVRRITLGLSQSSRTSNRAATSSKR